MKKKNGLLTVRGFKIKRLLLALGIVILLTAAILAATRLIGLSSGSALEADAQERLGVDEAWSCYIAGNKKMAALLFFDPAQEQYACAIYTKKDGLSYGYFFLARVINPAIADGVLQVSYRGEALALLSLNHKQVAQIVTDGQMIRVTPDAPFAHVLLQAGGSLQLADRDGNEVIPEKMVLP